MKNIYRTVALPVLFLSLLLALVGCGKNNIFSWAHQSGSGSDVKSLESDAFTALRDKDYTKAIECYNKILESDPTNSEALYGAASAQLADQGLDIGGLVANLIQQQSSAPERLAPALAYAARTQAASNLLPDTIVARMNSLRPVLNDVITKLEKIARGQADGKIKPDNPDVNLNLGLCYVLRAAITVQDSGISFDTDYKVLVTENNITLATEVGKDIVRAFYRFDIVYVALVSKDDSPIATVKADIRSLFGDLKAATGIDVSIDIDYF